MKTDTEYLQCLGLGLQGLRASGQFCDAMVCCGSTRILVHKVVLSAASKTLHDLALDFDMTPHRERDQLEIIIPPDVSLFAVNMFINYLYTGQLELHEGVVNHLLRLANVFGVTSLGNQCQEFIQKAAAPDSQDLNLREEKQTEPDSSCTNGVQLPGEGLFGNSEDATQNSSLTRSSSRSSGMGLDQSTFAGVSVKSEPVDFDVFHQAIPNSTSTNSGTKRQQNHSSPKASSNQKDQSSSMNVLQRLMSPVVNIQKLPSNITPDVVVMVSDDEDERVETGKSLAGKTMYTLAEREAIAQEAKRFGTTQVSRQRNIPLADILSWMAMFGLRHPQKPGKQVNHDADLTIVRWVVQQQQLKGHVDLNGMKKCALNIYRQTNPSFTASKTWLENFLKRNMSVLQGTQFCVENESTDASESGSSGAIVKKEVVSLEDLVNPDDMSEQNDLDVFGNDKVLESVPDSEERMLNEEVLGGFDDDVDDDNSYDDLGSFSEEPVTATSTPLPAVSGSSSVMTPFGKRPIIIGQSKCFDAKSERKIVQWVLERNARDGYVFTDDFKEYARSLYVGTKPFGATQAWMKKFLRRNRAIKDIRFCSKFKNVYTNKEKVAAVAMARRFGTAYACKHTGINQKIIHSWKLAVDRGQLILPASDTAGPSTPLTSNYMTSSPSFTPSPSVSKSNEALHGVVPEFEQRIIAMMKEFQEREGSINYKDISQISQSVYKETRPTFKASYSWIKVFMERHKDELEGLELENVSKVLIEDTNEPNAGSSVGGFQDDLSKEKISELVDNALKEIDFQDQSGNAIHPSKPLGSKRPVVVGPSVTFNRKTERQMVDWALERQAQEGYVFTDDFKDFAKSLHSGPKQFSASSGWMTLFLRRHRALKDVQWKSKFKNNYTEEEKKAAVAEAKRLGTGHVGRKLGIDPALICAWRIKMEKSAQKNTFWKGIKIKFGKGPKPIHTKVPISQMAPPIKINRDNDAARGIVPEFEQRIVQTILEQHEKDGSISYEEMSRISQDIYKETRSQFKASYAWLRNFLKRHEADLEHLNIENVKKVFIPDEEESDFMPSQILSAKRPIIIGQSRSLDTKSEKKLVEWVVEQQARDGYVFLDQFKKFAQSLYQGNKKFAATQAWRIKFLRRNHSALKHVRFTSSFRSQYDPEEKRAIVAEAMKYGTGHVSKKTGIDHCLINSWRHKMEKSGEILPEPVESFKPTISTQKQNSNVMQFASHLKKLETEVGPGLYSARGVVPQLDRKIVDLVNKHMDNEGSVSYQDVSNIARAVYKETRPAFKACYNWIKAFITRNKKALKHVDFDVNKRVNTDDNESTEILIPDLMEDVSSFVAKTLNENTAKGSREQSVESWESFEGQGSASSGCDPQIVIDNPEDPTYEPPSLASKARSTSSIIDIQDIASKKPVIVGTPVHFTRKIEKKLVEWLVERHAKEGFVFTDDFRDYARSHYTGPPGKFGATNAWIAKFLRRNKLVKKINFESRLKGNNPKYEEKIIELILEQQRTEGSVSNDDIQKITTSVYKDIRPNFRACYNWIRDFIKRHKEELKEVELENVKRVFIPDDDDENDGVIVRDFDPSSYYTMDRMLEDADNSHDASWSDMDSSSSFDRSRSQTPQQQPPSSVFEKLASQKRPVIIAPPKSLDVKTEKKLVQWMQDEQEKNGCVYLDLFKQYARSIHTGPKHFAATQAWMIRFKQRNHEALKNVKICSRFRKEYTIEEKMSAVEEAKRLGCHHVGRKLGINGGVIYSWKVQLEQAEKMGEGFDLSESRMETEECSRGQVPEFEEAIAEQVLELNKSKGSVTYDDISLIGRTVYQETRPHFKASNNWVLEFIRKNKERFADVNFINQKKFRTEEEKLHILSEEKKYGTDHVIKKRNISLSTINNWKRSMKAKAIPIPKYKALVGSKIMKKYAKGKKVQKIYTTEEKRKAVAIAEANGVTYAHLKLGISRNVLTKWIKYFRDQGEDIVINTTQAMTLRKELLQKVVSWVLEQNDELGVVLTDRIQEYAHKLFTENYCNVNTSRQWLESFITSNAEKFEKVRFREKGDKDLDFTDEIKVKLSRYSEKHGGVATAELSGTAPKNIYHWRRVMKQKGYNVSDAAGDDIPSASGTGLSGASLDDAGLSASGAGPSEVPEKKSLMQQKLDKIAMKYAEEERRTMVSEANIEGTKSVASKYKIPLPLLLKWMKTYSNDDVKPSLASLKASSTSSEPSPEVKPQGLLKVKLPSVERAKQSYSAEFKTEIIELVKKIGVAETSRRKGISSSTIYMWWGEIERESPSRFVRKSMDKSPARIGVDEIGNPVRIKPEPEDRFETSSVHSGSFSLSGADVSPHSIYLKGPRKYTEEEKMNAIELAIQIGIKQASQRLDIPLSNVRRWTSNYRNNPANADKVQALTPSQSPALSNSSFTVGIENPEVESQSNTAANNSLIIKRKFESSNESDLAKKRRISSSYNDEEKMAFVRDSEENGARFAAEKAKVSMDVIYKWRQKYLPRIVPPSPGPSTRRSSASSINKESEKIDDQNIVSKEDVLLSEKNMSEDVLDKSDEVKETLIEASDIPELPPFSGGGDLFGINSDYLDDNDGLHKEDSVIFPEVQEVDVVKSVEFEKESFPTENPVTNENSEVDTLKIVDVRGEYSAS